MITIQRLTPILLGLMLAGGLIVSATAMQPTVSASQNSQVQHLTCIQDTQGLMCNIDQASNMSKPVEQTHTPTAGSWVPEIITTEQLEQVSNLLLGIMYFGLPTALVFAVLRSDRQDTQRTKLIEQLERTWNQN